MPEGRARCRLVPYTPMHRINGLAGLFSVGAPVWTSSLQKCGRNRETFFRSPLPLPLNARRPACGILKLAWTMPPGSHQPSTLSYLRGSAWKRPPSSTATLLSRAGLAGGFGDLTVDDPAPVETFTHVLQRGARFTNYAPQETRRSGEVGARALVAKVEKIAVGIETLLPRRHFCLLAVAS